MKTIAGYFVLQGWLNGGSNQQHGRDKRLLEQVRKFTRRCEFDIASA